MTEVVLSKRAIFLASPIAVVVTANPKKPGTMAHERFEAYFTLNEGATVSDALKAGVRGDDLRHDSEHGFIVIGADAIKGLAEKQAADRAAEIARAKALLEEVAAAEAIAAAAKETAEEPKPKKSKK